MQTSMSQGSNLLRVVADGSRVRRAAGRLDDIHDAIGTALRRAVPFLGRRGSPVRVTGAGPESLGDALESLPRPWFVLPIVCAPGSAPASLAFDGDAVALLLDGLLGGDGQNPPTLSPEGLTGAQVALIARVAGGIVAAFSEVLERVGVKLSAAPATTTPARRNAGGSRDAIPIVVRIEFGSDSASGRMLLALPKDSLVERVAFEPVKKAPDARVVATVRQVEVELVAELGTRSMKLSELARLKVGDVVRFPTRVDGTANVRVGHRTLFTAKPTAQNGQIAVRVHKTEAKEE